MLRQLDPLEAGLARKNGGRNGDKVSFVTHQQRGFALALGRQQAVLRSFGHARRVAGIRSFARDVPSGAVGVVGDHDDLLGESRFGHQDVRRRHLEALDLGRFGVAEGHAFGKPRQDRPVILGIGVKTHAAAVGHLGGRLQQDEAASRIGAIETAAGDVVDQAVVVKLRIIAAQRQLEAVLPLGGAVAGPGGAADFVQDGLDVAHERDRARLLEVAHGHGQLRLEPARRDREARLAVLDRMQVTVFVEPHAVASRSQLGRAREINLVRLVGSSDDQDLAVVAGAREDELGRD